MRRWLIPATLVLVTAGAVVHGMDLCEYRSPMTDLSDLSIGFSYQYHNDPYGVPERDVDEGEFTVEYIRLFDKPEFGFDVTVRNDMNISVLDVSTYTTFADGSYKRYFSSERDFFAFAGGLARSSSSYQTLGLSINLGVGYGRFVDVTALARATRIDEYLVRRGSLTDHLHPVDLRALADEIGSLATHVPLSSVLAQVQDVIEGSGNVRIGGLDALDIAEITQLIEEEGFSRYCGWDLKLGLGYEILDPSGGKKDLLFTGALNYATATTPNEQFLIQGSFSGSPNLLETNRVDVTIAFDSLLSDVFSLGATYEFARETWIAEPTDTHRITFDLTLTPIDTAHAILSLVLEHRPYYTEWDVDIQLGIGIELL